MLLSMSLIKILNTIDSITKTWGEQLASIWPESLYCTPGMGPPIQFNYLSDSPPTKTITLQHSSKDVGCLTELQGDDISCSSLVR